LIVAVRPLIWGYEIAPPLMRAKRWMFSIDRDFEINFAPSAFFPVGWEIAPPPPPHPRRERWGTLVRGEDGTEAPQIIASSYGWETSLFWPPPRRYPLGGSIIISTDLSAPPTRLIVPSGARASDSPVFSAIAFTSRKGSRP
jgi:hypothetical protein